MQILYLIPCSEPEIVAVNPVLEKTNTAADGEAGQGRFLRINTGTEHGKQRMEEGMREKIKILPE